MAQTDPCPGSPPVPPLSSKRPRSPTRLLLPEKRRRGSGHAGAMRDTTSSRSTDMRQDESIEELHPDPPGHRHAQAQAPTVLLSSTPWIVAMDQLLRHCDLWQDQLARWSRELARKVEKCAMHEVQHVVQDLVTSVETRTLVDQVQTMQRELQWVDWFQEDVVACLTELHQDRQDTESFEAMEKQLINDRVVELETQLAQKRAVEKEKEMELSLLRADHEQLLQSSRVGLDQELETVVARKEAVDVELKQVTEKMKQQSQTLTVVEEERARLELHHQELVEEVRQLREEQETREFKSMQQQVKQEEEIKHLHATLQLAKTREAKTTAALEMTEQMMEKSKQRKEELQILYAKFSSAMDSVSEKTMRLEELEQELKDAQIIRHQNEQLEKQVAQLQQEKAELSATRHREKDDIREELALVRKQLKDSRELASQQKELASKLQSEVKVLKDQNEALRKQQVKQEHQSVGQPSKECDKQNTDIDNDLVVQVAEKEALQMVMQGYYSAAETKCRRLLEKVSELELQCRRTQEQTKESCSLLRMCAQVDDCDESVRASMLDVIATLEGFT